MGMNRRKSFGRLAFLLAAVLTLAGWQAQGEARVTVSTNYYTVTGTTTRQLMASIAQSTPWKSNRIFHAYTHWNVSWSFSIAPADDQFRIARADTRTKITITLPRWAAPTNAAPEVIQQWKDYLQRLSTHEAGHVKIAREAGEEVHRALHALGSAATAEELKQTIKRTADQILENAYRRERDYDRTTQHGMAQGASLW